VKEKSLIRISGISNRVAGIICDDPRRLHVEKKHPAVFQTAGFLFSRPFASELATAYENKNIRQNWRMFFHL
jgi:hypothetical protein